MQAVLVRERGKPCQFETVTEVNVPSTLYHPLISAEHFVILHPSCFSVWDIFNILYGHYLSKPHFAIYTCLECIEHIITIEQHCICIYYVPSISSNYVKSMLVRAAEILFIEMNAVRLWAVKSNASWSSR